VPFFGGHYNTRLSRAGRVFRKPEEERSTLTIEYDSNNTFSV
jgi:hypothetical protein